MRANSRRAFSMKGCSIASISSGLLSRTLGSGKTAADKLVPGFSFNAMFDLLAHPLPLFLFAAILAAPHRYPPFRLYIHQHRADDLQHELLLPPKVFYEIRLFYFPHNEGFQSGSSLAFDVQQLISLQPYYEIMEMSNTRSMNVRTYFFVESNAYTARPTRLKYGIFWRFREIVPTLTVRCFPTSVMISFLLRGPLSLRIRSMTSATVPGS